MTSNRLRKRTRPAGSDPSLMDFASRRRVYVLPEYRVMYVSVPKNACTSLKWLFAELAGEDLEDLRRGELGFSPTREGQIHNRKRWRPHTQLSGLDPEVRSSISPANGWFVFGVVRDPRLRLFSAWQDKYLLRAPGYYEHWDRPDAKGHPIPRTPSDVIDAFADFVFTVVDEPEHEYLQDGHFASQVHALDEDLVDYSRLYDMTELGQLVEDLRAHLAREGFEGQVALGRSNSSPFAVVGDLFENGVREAVERLYSADFERFGDRWDFSGVEQRRAADLWTPDAFAHARSIIAMCERTSDVVRAARGLRRTNARLEQEVAALRAQLD